MAEEIKAAAGLPEWLGKYGLMLFEWNGVRGWFGAVPVSKIDYNKGQVEGLPANPRQWTQDELETLKRSIKETPELTLARGVLAYPYDGRLVSLGGNMRYAAARSLDEKTVPTFVYPADTPVEKLMEIVVKDNGQFGAWDVDALANEWNVPFKDWGVPDWVTGGGQGDGQERKSGSRAAGKGDVNGGFAFAVKVEFEDSETQVAFLAEMEERGLKAAAV